MWQNIIVSLIILGAIAYVLRSLIRSFKPRKGAGGASSCCSSCSSCSCSKPSDIAPHPKK